MNASPDPTTTDTGPEYAARAKRQQEALASFVFEDAIAQGDVIKTARRLSVMVSNAIGVERVGIWLLSEQNDEMVCVEQWQESESSHSSGMTLVSSDFPRYWEALQQDSRITADDALSHPATRDFADVLLKPLGITSMLDAGILVNGEFAGVICLEHTGERRHWHQDEMTFASAAAILMSQVLAQDARNRSEAEGKRLQERLIQAEKMESVGRLAGGVAHDFNNMLAVILGQTEIALSQLTEGDPGYNSLKEIQQAGQRSSRLTQQLLAFARRQPVNPEVIDLNHSLESMISMLRRLIGESVTLDWQLQDNLWPVRVDPSQLDQIVVNLCVNARDAMGGRGRVRIATNNLHITAADIDELPEASVGDFVRLSVRDEGTGIEAADLENLFEPFFTTKQTDTGTGLGLAVVYGAVMQSGGFIHVDSAPDRGTTFHLYFPRERHELVAVDAPEKPSGNKRQREKVLLVEDEVAVLRMTTAMLEQLGYDVVPARSVSEALRIIESPDSGIRLLVTDVVMPEMSGKSLAERVMDSVPDVKVLFISGYTSNVLGSGGTVDASFNFLQKPFSAAELDAKIQEALSG
ncbi:MAG: ATP-binding protein [Pseudomonadota bacterium]